MSNPNSLPPGFRFHPTDEELILHYLRNRAASTPCPVSIIAEVDIYKFDPWDLPAKAKFGDREWYFFSPRDRKYPNGVRPNRAAASGYWKATRTDKPIHTGNENIGVKKALVFYKGRPPKGLKTNWIMHEYRIAEAGNSNCYKPVKLRDHSMRLDDWVLCRIYKKNNSLSSSVPPLMDQELEDSGTEDPYLPTLQNLTQENNTLKLPKSSSISDLLEDYSALSHLFDTQPEFNSLLAANQTPNQLFVNGSNSGNGSSYLVPQRFETELAAELDQNSPSKRQRITTEGYPKTSKKENDSGLMTNFSNLFDGPPYSFLNQQLLLNPHFGSH